MKNVITGLVAVVLVVVVFGVLVPSFASYEEIGEALSGLTLAEWLSMAVVFLCLELLKASPAAVMVDRLSLPQSFVADESSKVASNSMPGPSGTLARLAIYKSYGLDLVDFTQATLVNSVLNNGVTLLLPLGALGVIISRGSVPGIVWWLTGVALLIVVVCALIIWQLLRRESSARRLGEWVGSLFDRLEGLRGKTTDRDWADAAADMRHQLIEGFTHSGVRVAVILLAKHATAILLLTMAFRSAGVTVAQLSIGGVFIVYAFTSIATIVQVTPGGVGVSEVAMISIATAVAPGSNDIEITAGVLVYRIFTYVGPMILGLGTLFVWRRFMGGGSITEAMSRAEPETVPAAVD